MRRLLLIVAVLLAGLLAAGAWVWTSAPQSNVGDLAFENELRIPPLAEPAASEPGRKVFDLELEEVTSELRPGEPSTTWGVDGAYLGPTLRAQRGDEVTVNVRNALPETTTLHWHGMHLPAEMDGGPHQPIQPGTTWSPSWTIDQPAATLWYHPHLDGATEEHVYRGIAGLFIVEDPKEAALALPDEYGVDDIPVIVQDVRLNDDGGLDDGRSPISPIGPLGDEILVNETHDPHVVVRHRRVRFRLLNASRARIYSIGFADRREFALVGTDGGLLEAPAPISRIRLSPGERAEIVPEFRPGERVVLRSFEPDLGTNAFEGRFSGADDSFDLLQVRAAAQLAPSADPPERLAEHDAPAEPTRVRRFRLNGRSINGRKMDMDRIDEVVWRGTTELWEVENTGGTPHSFHPHDVRFTVLGDPPPELSGLKDTIYVAPSERLRLLVRFDDYADPQLPYMFHCHLLDHEDAGMMGQFAVSGGRPPA